MTNCVVFFFQFFVSGRSRIPPRGEVSKRRGYREKISEKRPRSARGVLPRSPQDSALLVAGGEKLPAKGARAKSVARDRFLRIDGAISIGGGGGGRHRDARSVFNDTARRGGASSSGPPSHKGLFAIVCGGCRSRGESAPRFASLSPRTRNPQRRGPRTLEDPEAGIWRPTTPRRRRRGRRPRRTWGSSRRSASPRPGRSIDGQCTSPSLLTRGHVAVARTRTHARRNVALRATVALGGCAVGEPAGLGIAGRIAGFASRPDGPWRTDASTRTRGDNVREYRRLGARFEPRQPQRGGIKGADRNDLRERRANDNESNVIKTPYYLGLLSITLSTRDD